MMVMTMMMTSSCLDSTRHVCVTRHFFVLSIAAVVVVVAVAVAVVVVVHAQRSQLSVLHSQLDS